MPENMIINTPSSKSVEYGKPNGTRYIKRGGTLAWRNNNPGNIKDSDFARRKGAMGSNKGFAIFPDYETGRKAMEDLFETNSYENLNINKALQRYAPKSENDTEKYLDFVENSSGLDRDQSISELSKTQKEKLLDSIEEFEGNLPGETIPIPQDKPSKNENKQEFDATGRRIRD